MSVVARSSEGDASKLVPGMRAAVGRVDGALPLYDVATMETRLRDSTAVYRFLLRLLGALGIERAPPGGHRRVRGGGLLGGSAAAGDRHPHGAGGHRARGAPARQPAPDCGRSRWACSSASCSRCCSAAPSPASCAGSSTTDLVTLGAVALLLLGASVVAVVVPSRRAAPRASVGSARLGVRGGSSDDEPSDGSSVRPLSDVRSPASGTPEASRSTRGRHDRADQGSHGAPPSLERWRAESPYRLSF